MLPRERVITVIEHGRPDRIPIYGWLGNLEDEIAENFGSVATFEDRYGFDFAHLWGIPFPYWGEEYDRMKREADGAPTPADLMEVPIQDPDDEAAYEPLVAGIEHHKQKRGRFTLVQSHGIFERLNGVWGIENHLMYLALYPHDLRRCYRRQAEFNRTVAMNCLDLGVDMIHVSDDWGSQRGLMFSPQTWWDLIHPAHKVTADAVKDRGAYLSLHCDGNFTQVIDGVLELGYDVVHPWQESADMPLQMFREKYRDRLTVMGGLDVQTTLGFGDFERLRLEIERVVGMFRDGGLMFCTSHAVQEHCSIGELKFAYDTVYRLVRETRE